MKIAIYGVFIKDRCIYVGRSSNMEIRSTAHTRRFRKLFSDPPQVRTLKTVSLESSAEVEWAMIRLYKDLGQADFNSEPGFRFRNIKPPKSERCVERAKKIVELVQKGHPRKEIAQQLKVSESEISNVCLVKGICALAGRKFGTGVGYGRKLNRAQHEEILRRDENNIPHAEIGALFGVSRERIRQICEGAGHRTRRDKQREQIRTRREALVAERAERKVLKRLTPTKHTLLLARLWQEGKTITQIAEVVNNKPESTAVWIVRLRQRHPELFSYRRPEALRWRGINLKQWPGYEQAKLLQHQEAA